MKKNNVLVVCGHPNLDYSRVNKAVLNKLEEYEVTIHTLCESHQNYTFDVEAEQTLLVEHNRIVLLFPLYWYSMPALMKKWIDDVLLPGFAYARNGDKLKDKEIFVATTVGALAEGYRAGGFNRFTLDELLKPIELLTYYVKAKYLPPFAIYESVFIDQDKLTKNVAECCEKIVMHHDDPSVKYEEMLLMAEEMQIDLIS